MFLLLTIFINVIISQQVEGDDSMLTNLNIQPKTLKILSLILTVTGIIFILASNYIGSIAIRLTMIIILVFCSINFKTTYKYLTLKEKINYLVAVTSAILGIYKPELTILILGVFLLYITLPIYIKSITSKDYSDIIMLIISGTGILFAVLCISNSKAALQTIITIIGISFTILGCILLYQILISIKDKNYEDYTEDDIYNIEDNLSS
jgi:hypothetical protein